MRYIIPLALASTALPALADVPSVVTDMPAVQSIAAQVMGELGQPVLLLEKGANAHSFQLRPSQAAAVADADLVLWMGAEMTPWMERALEGITSDSSRIALLANPATTLRTFGDAAGDKDVGHNDAAADHDDHSGHDHAEEGHAEEDHGGHDHAEHGHAEAGHEGHDHAEKGHAEADHAEHSEAGDDHADHDHSGTDPHAWLDPANAQAWAKVMAAELSRLDPENAATYAANAAATVDRIAALDAEISAILAPAQDKPFVVFHDAYGYFAAHYGLTIAGSVALGDAASPGAARIRDLSEKVAAGGALCLFPEAQHDPALISQMAEGTQARIGEALDPSGSTLDPGPEAYDALLRGLATRIADCLKG